MTSEVPQGVAALRLVAESRRDLADRVYALTAGLAIVRPRAADPEAGSVRDGIETLVRMGVIRGAEADDALASPAAFSSVMHRVLERALSSAVPGIYVGNEVVKLALVLGQEFEPSPQQLFGLFERARDPRMRDQLAWLAGHRGADELVNGLMGLLDREPVPVLRFLEAVQEDYRLIPLLRAAPPAAAAAGPPPDDPAPTASQPSAPSRAARPPEGPHRAEQAPSGPRARAPRPSVEYGPGIVSALVGFIRSRRRARARLSRPDARAPDNVAAVVSTGFCAERGARGLPTGRTLAAGRRYEFFVEIARELADDAIETSSTPLPPLAAGTVLQVNVFGFDGQLQHVTGSNVGELRLLGDGTAIVEKQPGGEPGGRRLYLPVLTPTTPGTYRMRCNIYCRQVLLQSRLIEAQVTARPRTARGAVSAALDFAAVTYLEPEHLEALQPRTLSVLINDNGNGTHGFQFFGEDEFSRGCTLAGETLSQELEKARKCLRLVSWDTEEEPTREQFEKLARAYRYAQPSRETLIEDLVALARCGYNIWDVLIGQLSGGQDEELTERMKAPGRVEFANKESLDLLVPAACLYDYPLNAYESHLTVCPSFLEALGVMPLAEIPCFNGRCPSYDDRRVVCPSGFWGFRHQIGYSASLTGGKPGDAVNHALTVGATPGPVFTVGASADKALTQRDEHLRRLQLLAGDRWHFAWSRTGLFALFEATAPSVVYLYGHGGMQGTSPYFEVGSGDDGPIIRSALRGIANWSATNPLVFLNGCRSAALSPAIAFSYATGFLQTAHASAVIGTEIAVFESLAAVFAEECLYRFVVKRRKLGEAVRESRLALLEKGIPLGLAYLAFGPTEVHLPQLAEA